MTVTPERPVPSLDAGSGVPLYLQVERSLAERIDRGEWPPGTQLPSEGELCVAYGVSRVTMRQAFARLVDRGLVSRARGRGTFVRDQSVTAGARGASSLTVELAELGLSAGSQVLEQTVVTAAASGVADELRLAPDDAVLRLRRLRIGGDRPIGVQTALLPLARFPGLDSVDFDGRSLYATLKQRYGVAPSEAIETFTVIGVPSAEARLLGVRPGSHAFHVERLTFDARGPFESVRSVMRGDRYRVRLVLRES